MSILSYLPSSSHFLRGSVQYYAANLQTCITIDLLAYIFFSLIILGFVMFILKFLGKLIINSNIIIFTTKEGKGAQTWELAQVESALTAKPMGVLS